MRRIIVLTLGLVAAPAAAETTKSFTVGATIVRGCAVRTIGAGEWGHIDLGTVPGTSTQTVEADLLASGTGIAIECTPGTTASVTADTGLNPVSGVRALAPQSGAARVRYRLILDGGAEWNGQAVPMTFTTGQGVRRLPLRGRAVLTGGLPAGRYTDTVRVTIAW